MSEALYVRVEQSFRGDKASITATLHGLADLLEAQIDVSVADDLPSSPEATRWQFLEVVSKESARLEESFAHAGPAFEAAVRPSGGPRDYAAAYAGLLGDLQSAADAVRSARAPQSLKRTEEAFTALLETLAGQLKSWPEQLRQAAHRVRGNSFDVKLEARAKVDPYYDALLKDTSGDGAAEKPIEKMFFHPSTPVEVIVDAIRAKARELGLTQDLDNN